MTTITIDRAIAEQAIEVLESLQGGCTDSNDGTVEAITVWCPEVIRAALAEQPQDWDEIEALRESLREHMSEIHRLRAALADHSEHGLDMVIATPQRAPLTDEEIHDCFQQSGTTKAETRRLIARALERAHGIGDA